MRRARGTSKSRTPNTSTWAEAKGKKPKQIKYTGGYKYQLTETYTDFVPIYPHADVNTFFIKLTRLGELTIRKGYAWDGPSGLTIDTKSFMRGSLVHDALYQLMRYDLLGQHWRRAVDKTLHTHCVQDKMFECRARLVYRALRVGGGPAADPRNRKKVYTAP